MKGGRRKVEFGDFQTPMPLAEEVCNLVAGTGFSPASIIEPTCGSGSFLLACLKVFPDARRVLGFDVDPGYVELARGAVDVASGSGASVEVRRADFFQTDWSFVRDMPDPLLVIGNPPWVTSAELGRIGGRNQPVRSNQEGLSGIDALTGMSNFDISEWMIRRNLEWLHGREGMLAVLCKTSVARRVLADVWRKGARIASASIYRLNAREHFGVAVDACLLLIRTQPRAFSDECLVYDSLHATQPTGTLGWRDGMLVSDVGLYEKWRELIAPGGRVWRSGIKHDAGKVLELSLRGGCLINGFGERVDVERQVLFPLLKGSDLAAHSPPRRWLIVTQRAVGEDTGLLKTVAPKAWSYLESYSHVLDARKSSVYRNRPRFAMFGVGPYSFAPWKVAISGLHKKLDFVLVPPFQGRPVVLDDTCYFVPCRSERDARLIHSLVLSEPAQELLSALIFWDAKRPITARVLNSLDLAALARKLGVGEGAVGLLYGQDGGRYGGRVCQLPLFDPVAC